MVRFLVKRRNVQGGIKGGIKGGDACEWSKDPRHFSEVAASRLQGMQD